MFEVLDKWNPDDNLLDRFIPSDHCGQASADIYVLQFLRDNSIRRVLDLGCGSGYSYELFRREIANVEWVGLDVAGPPEGRSRRRTGAAFCAFDGIRIPFREAAFDLVYCRQVLHHAQRPWELLREVRRVLKPGGRFVGSTSQLEPYQSYSHWNFTLYGFSRLVEEAGLRLDEVRPGIDSLTLILRRALGRGRFSARWFDHDSPFNAMIGLIGWMFRKDRKWINRIKLFFCGCFCFCATKVSDDAPSGGRSQEQNHEKFF